MTHTLSKLFRYGFVVLAVSLLAYLMGVHTFSAGASAPSGLMSTVATTSLMGVGPSLNGITTLFATSSCTARIITTYANPIMLTFSDYAGDLPTGVFGHLQAASTTSVYDSGLYGCGRVRAYGFVATTSITVSETR